jgi:hypothetical protein
MEAGVVAAHLLRRSSDRALEQVADLALQDTAVEHIERGEQGRRAMPLVVMRHRPAAALLHRQPRLGAVERLDLRLLVDRLHQRVLRLKVNEAKSAVARPEDPLVLWIDCTLPFT